MIVHRLKQDPTSVNKKTVTQKLRVVVYVIVVFILGFSLIQSFGKLISSRNELNKARLLLEEEGNTLEKNQENLSTVKQNSYTERVARDTLGLAKPEEIVLLLPPEAEVQKLSPRLFTQRLEEPKEKAPGWKRWLQLLF